MPGVSGTIAAAFTPRGKNGDVDFGAFFDLLDFLGRAHLAGVALFTAAGEYPSISLDERTRLTYLAVKRSRIPVLAGVGSSTLDHSIQLAREARDAGASALLLPPPYFYALDPSDIHEFYARFAARIGPGATTLLVNTPPLTPAIDPAAACDLIDAGHYVGIVESDPLAGAALGRPWLSANDGCFSQARRGGASGAISEVACVAPELVLALDRALCAGDLNRAELLDRELQTAAAWFAEFPQPAALKAAAALRKLKTGAETASPLTAAKQVRMDAFRHWFPDWIARLQEFVAHA